MSKAKKFYDVNFTLAQTALFTVSATSEKEARKIAESWLDNGVITKEELIDRLLAAVDCGGLKI